MSTSSSVCNTDSTTSPCSSPDSTPMSSPSKPKVKSDREIAKLKKDIHVFARKINEECERFIDNHIEVNGEEDAVNQRIPTFFIKSYNFLKKEAESVSYEDRFLDFIPQCIRMKVTTEQYGPPNCFPEADENGYLKDEPKRLADELVQFYVDVIEYVRFTFVCTGKIPILPHSYYLTLFVYQKRVEESTLFNKSLVRMIPEVLQSMLNVGTFGNQNIGIDYVTDCTREHYKKSVNTDAGIQFLITACLI
eukprot:NP_499736.1 Uncharacterized protein CELE_F56A8.8 [Caenorhabditis elegans]